jgi:membrane associated rhomboid family serine protease
MFPIRDHNPSERTPFVTYALILANVLVFLYQLPIAEDDGALAEFYYTWALYPAAVTEYGEYHGIFTSMFVHAGFLHIAGNMLFLWIFGDNLEDQMGHLGFLAFYLASGVAAAIGHIVADPASVVPTVGASGAIAGVMGGYLLLFPRAKVDIFVFFLIFYRIFSIPAWIMLGVWFAMQVWDGFGVASMEGGVAYWAHAAGFVAGLVLTLPVWVRRGGPAFWQTTHGQPPHPEAVYSTSTIPIVRRRK